MSKSILSISVVLLFLFSGSLRSQNNVTNTIANFDITENGTKFNFDIFTLRTSAPDFRMGNSSYFLRFVTGTFANPVLTYVNPKYTVGSVTSSYNEMQPFGYSSGKVAIQLYYNSGGPGDVISNDPGVQGFGEKIASVKLDIITLNLPDLRWDNINTAVVNPQNESAISTNNGFYNSALPVELSSFSAVSNGNSVKLSWSTSSEENNAGFEVQRKSATGDWIKAGYVQGSGNSVDLKNYTYNDNQLPTGSYSYRLKQIDFNGNYEFHNLSTEIEIGIPKDFALNQNFPNPFNPSTVISFDLPYDSRVSLSVYDISGRRISMLIDNELKQANYYSVTMNGSSLSSGVYFYELRTDKEVQTKKMTLVK
jgi:hypothetical protein